MILPGELMPLHIFEERYQRMIGHCLEEEEPFGIVFRDDDGGARRIGCTARVTEVIERFDDGRMNIVVKGELPFKVLDRYEARSTPAARSSRSTPRTSRRMTTEAADVARDAFAELVERVSGEPPEGDELAAEDSYAIAARVELPAETKQRCWSCAPSPTA